MTKNKKNLVGAWVQTNVTDIIKELALCVLAQNDIKTQIDSITNVSKQIVNGINYRFDVSLNNGNNYTAQVYVNNQGVKQVTEFKIKEVAP
jgi:hypothetical protein